MKASLPFILLLSLIFVGCGGGSMSNTPPPPPPTITGAWNGSITSTSVMPNVTVSMSGRFQEGVKNPDGSIQFSGSLSIPTACISVITINNGNLAGGAFVLSGSATDGTIINANATVNVQDTQMNGNWSTTAGTSCASDHGTFQLNKQ